MIGDHEVDRILGDWQAMCRANDVLRSLPTPSSANLVRAVAVRVIDGGGSPDAVLKGLAAGLAAEDWHASGEVLQLQVGLLMQVMAGESGADHARAAYVHTLLSTAAAAVAIEAWRDKAEQDELTGLRNRAGWESDSTFWMGIANPFAYASIDLDGLKDVNDGPGGHAAGDDLLRGFARRLEIAIQSIGGSAYRYGGDEFSAVLSLEAGDLAAVLAELSSTVGVAAFSHGIALWPENDQDLQTVVSVADRRMYEVKAMRKRAPLSSAAESAAESAGFGA